MNSIMKMLFQLYILPAFGKFVADSTQIITDLAAAAAITPSATALAAATAAAGPNMDIPGLLTTCVLKAKEIRDILNYVLGGKQTVPASLTAPTGGVITSAADSTMYDDLVSVFQILK